MSEGKVVHAATVVLLRDGASGPEVLMVRRPDRGSFAGGWVFPGGKVEHADHQIAGADADEIAVARIAAVRETREEVGLEVVADALVPISRWMPPKERPLRIRTWFFVAEAPAGVIVPQLGEVEEFRWVHPQAALDAHGRDEFRLYPPTWMTLHGMSDQPDAAAVLAEARLAGIRHFDTVRPADQPTLSVWPGLDMPALQMATLPWSLVAAPDATSSL